MAPDGWPLLACGQCSVCYSAPADWFTFGVASSASLTTTASEAQYKAELQLLEQLDEENYFPFGAFCGEAGHRG